MKQCVHTIRWIGIAVLLLAFTVIGQAFFAFSSKESMQNHALAIVKAEHILEAIKNNGLKDILITKTPWSDEDIKYLISRQPVCLIVDNTAAMEEVKERFFSVYPQGIILVQSFADLDPDTIDGTRDIIMHRNVVDDLLINSETVLRDNLYVSIWYDLDEPTSVFYLGTIGMTQHTTDNVTLKIIRQRSIDAARQAGLSDELNTAQRIELLMIQGLGENYNIDIQ